MADNVEAVRSNYLQGNKAVNLQTYFNNLEKEEKSGLKGIEIREKAKELGKNDFLQLLITQLSTQDPTEPMKDQAFIAQMAQFSSLEQMNNISNGIQKMGNRQNFSLVGKIVSGPDFTSGEEISGVAGAVFFDGQGQSFVRVNGRSIEVDKITLISDPSLLEQQATKNQQQMAVSPATSNQEMQVSKSDEAKSPQIQSDSARQEAGQDWKYPGKPKESTYED